ncbi:oxidoreductase [Marmoricola endophyticus]|uniref:Oxidoreductase n=1 Tax=Marmoricola endophyticus TaxID=2040280 RepID=A0A917BN04_9ACTN|nr:SDR family oxidoreductase [Marmoricola endophyticus]GGF51324.1 oxidoreductase [Marmoricola endophyticus]
MKVFVTGASGWIGSAVTEELLGAGHEVLGLVRSDASATRVEALGARALRGDLDDLDSLRAGATEADAVVHLANKHDWSDPEESDRAERAAVETLLAAIEGTQRPFVIANGLSGLVEGRAALESDRSPAVGPTSDRGGSENLVLETGGRGIAVRFAPSVHGVGDWGFVAFLAGIAREKGVSAYVGDGVHAWSAVHRADAARLIRLGLEQAPAGTRMHAVAEQEITTRAIAEALGEALDLPVHSVPAGEAGEHFGFMAEFFAASMTGSSDATRALLGWTPSGPGLLDDIAAGAYAGD